MRRSFIEARLMPLHLLLRLMQTFCQFGAALANQAVIPFNQSVRRYDRPGCRTIDE